MNPSPRITGLRVRGNDHSDGLAFARALRIRMKPYFDAIYGAADAPKPCRACGQVVR